MKLRDQLNLSAVLVVGSHLVEIETGRTEPDGSPEVLLAARGDSDLHAIRQLISFCDHALAERGHR